MFEQTLANVLKCSTSESMSSKCNLYEMPYIYKLEYYIRNGFRDYGTEDTNEIIFT